MEGITVRQIFFDTDMRQGHFALTQVMNQHKIYRDSLKVGEVVIFINRDMHLMKAVAREGIYSDRLPRNEHFDFSLRREQILENIGKWFGMSFRVSGAAFQRVQRRVKRYKNAA